MVRRDERGVVVPAPVRAATAGLPRYDDEHRGPTVADAYALSTCWIDLAEDSESWFGPDNFPPALLALAQQIPDDQRSDWLRRQANLEKVDRLISDAMRSGELPIWVAPVGGPEQQVAPGAMLEVDQATIRSGCYRPPNDRGWLYGRPLFVKWDDWVRFKGKVQETKMKRDGPASGREDGFASQDGPIMWNDLDPEYLPELERLCAQALQDEWWTWPEAIAWMGSRDVKNIATMRFWGPEFSRRSGLGPAYTFRIQAWMAMDYCERESESSAELLKAIECGKVSTSGRASKGAVAINLPPNMWRGGTVVFHDGEAVLIDARSKLTVWAFDVAVRRADLVRIFPTTSRSATFANSNTRAPSVKSGRPPTDEEILAKADEMKQRGLSGRELAAMMRHESGFANVPTTLVRELIKGRWKGGRRKRKDAS